MAELPVEKRVNGHNILAYELTKRIEDDILIFVLCCTDSSTVYPPALGSGNGNTAHS